MDKNDEEWRILFHGTGELSGKNKQDQPIF